MLFINRFQANSWCRRGVDLLSGVPLELTSSVASSTMNVLDDFLVEGEQLQLDALKPTPNMNNLILLTTTETSSLLAQVCDSPLIRILFQIRFV